MFVSGSNFIYRNRAAITVGVKLYSGTRIKLADYLFLGGLFKLAVSLLHRDTEDIVSEIFSVFKH